MIHRSMRNGSRVADELYIKRVLMVLEDFLFFSLYSFSCIASNSTTLKDLLILVSRYALRVQSCNIHIACARSRPLHRQCMPYYDVVNLVTATGMNMIRRNALWLCKDHCCENTAPGLRPSCAAVSAAPEVSHRAALQSYLLSKSPADLRRGLRSSKL